ncbi:CRISPR-associated protein, Cse2 family [Desulfatibacillum aliphaticivorans]|uniref:CRISPR-associated protein, Cse2 family n=1 Tax=Desulfatibacillum aliphaticivorans TaxID=218208 RepID=B8FDH7_DESAL|nr:type I-E CRISPR-associated protein Cse2/CasB [Desulfatibacillum aliphaticivorans]ACL06608.1 CRISPR-associated protein, Cse2 family [Desulfatibacillum aliphaticivorans]
MEKDEQLRKTRGTEFVSYAIKRMAQDAGYGARLRRADNPATESQSWEHLVGWCDLEKPWERTSFASIAAALARAKPEKDGAWGIGRALASCYDEKKDSQPARARLRRLLACDDAEEACRVLRPMLALIRSKGKPLCYARLLDELLWFGEKRKLRWAEDFFGRREQDDSDHVHP